MSRQYVTSPYAQGAASPVARQPLGVPVVAQLLVLGTAAATTLLLVAAGVIATLQESALRRWWEGPALESGTVSLLNLLVSLTALTNVVAFVATGLWLLRVRAIAEQTPPNTSQRRSAYWAFLGWVVPVVNLWFPLQVVEDASRGVGSKVRTYWPWWIAWLAMIGFSLFGGSDGRLLTEADFAGWIRAHQISAVLAVVAFVLWWRVVRSATVAANAAVDEVRVAS